MISTLEKEITFRYLKSRKKDGFLNIISIFSFIGISLGVAVLIIVMSVMNGFRSELINKIVGFNSHITITPYEKPINTKKLNNSFLKEISEESIFSNSGEAVIVKKKYTKGIILRGYKKKDFPRLKITQQADFIGQAYRLDQESISIGEELSLDLNVGIGDKLSIISPSGIDTIVGKLPKQQVFVVSSIFKSGLIEFDRNVAFININSLESFFNLDHDKRNLEIYLKSPANIEKKKIKYKKYLKTNL